MTTFQRVREIVWMLKDGHSPSTLRAMGLVSARHIDIAVDCERFS